VSELEALQEALAAEQAIVYGYGVLGAHLSGTQEAYAMQRLTSHMLRRDKLAAAITADGATPVLARVAYALPFPVDNQASARELGGHLELGAADAAWDLAAAADARSASRSLAVAWLTDAAVSAEYWGASQALPGQPV
jgi:hypothetical protein